MAQSLIGKADATLVNAAFAEAKSQIPADMSGIMETMTETQKELDKQFVDMATDLFGNINASNEEMKGLVDPIYKSLQNGTFSDQDMMSFKGVLDGFRDEWKTIPKGKDGEEARMQWKNKVNRFNNTITSFDQKLLELSADISGENYIPAGLQGLGGRDADKNLKFLNSIYRLKSGKEGNKATMSVDEKGDVFFTSTIDGEEIKMSMQEISDFMPKKDITVISGVDKLVMTNGKKVGATKGSVYDPTSISDGVFKLLNNAKVPRDAFQTLAHYDYGGGSFFQDLYSPSGPMGKTVITALEGLQYSDNAKKEFDKDGVPGITAGDFTYNNGENRKAIADYIMSNDKIGRKVLSKWFAATEGQSAFNAGRNLIPKSGENKKGEQGLFFGNKNLDINGDGSFNVSGKSLTDFSKKINNREDIDFGADGKYEWRTDRYYFVKKGQKDQEIKSKKSMILNFTNQDSLSKQFQTNPNYKKIKDWYSAADERQFEDNQTLYNNDIDLGFDISNFNVDDNVLASNLNLMLAPSGTLGNKPGYRFETKKLDEKAIIPAGNFFIDQIALRLPDSNEIVKYPKGHPKEDENVVLFSELENPEDQQEQLDILKDILDTFDLYDGLKPLVK